MRRKQLLYSVTTILVGLSMSACNQSESSSAQIQEFLVGDGTSVKIDLKMASSDELSAFIVECPGGSSQICVAICHRAPGHQENEKSKILPLQASIAHLDHGNVESDHLGLCEDDDDHSDDYDEDDYDEDDYDDDHDDNDDNDDNDDDHDNDDGEHEDDADHDDDDGDENGSSDSEGDEGSEDSDNSNDGSDEDTGNGGSEGSNGDPVVIEPVPAPEPTPEPVPEELPAWCVENIERDADCDGINDIDGTPIY